MSIIQRVLTEQNKSTFKWISAGFAVFGVIYLGKVLYTKLTTTKKPTNQKQTPHKSNSQSVDKTPERLNTKVTQYSEYYFDKDLQLKYIEQTISDNPTVQQIYLNSPLIARDQFIKYTRQIRKRRRLIRKSNQDQYVNLVLTYESEIKQLLFRSRVELLDSLQINPQLFQRMEQNYQAIEDLRAINRKSEQILRAKLKTDTKYKKMSDQTLTKIIQQQLCFMHNKMYDRLREKLLNEQMTDQHQILLVVQTLLQDIIYQKFGYEPEDVIRKIEEVGYNTKQIDEARSQMEINVGGFKFESLQSQQDPQQVNGRQNIKKTSNTLHRSGQHEQQK